MVDLNVMGEARWCEIVLVMEKCEVKQKLKNARVNRVMEDARMLEKRKNCLKPPFRNRPGCILLDSTNILSRLQQKLGLVFLHGLNNFLVGSSADLAAEDER